jgi:hypothetical protein
MRRGNPFSVLRRLRAIDEKLERAKLANTREAHDRARQRLEEMKAIHREDIDLGGILGPMELRALQLRGVSSSEMLGDAARVFQQSERQLRARSDSWRKAAADVDAAERLDNRRRQEMARAAVKSTEKSLDDLMSMLHARKGERS